MFKKMPYPYVLYQTYKRITVHFTFRKIHFIINFIIFDIREKLQKKPKNQTWDLR